MKSINFLQNHSDVYWPWIVWLMILVPIIAINGVYASTPKSNGKNQRHDEPLQTMAGKTKPAVGTEEWKANALGAVASQNGLLPGSDEDNKRETPVLFVQRSTQKEEGQSIALPSSAPSLWPAAETSPFTSQGNEMANYLKNQMVPTAPAFVAAPVTIKVCYNSDPYGISGSEMSFADEKLTNPANWGPSGTDTRYQFSLFSFGTGAITEAALAANGCQIFVAGGTNTDAGSFSASTTSALSAADKNALKNWALDKKNVLIAFQGFAIFAGGSEYVASSGSPNPNTLTPLGNAIVSGLFGTITSFNQGGGTRGRFTGFPSTACVISQDANDNPTGLLNSLTGDFYLSDHDMITELSGLTNNSSISSASNTDKFFASLMSAAATIVVNGPSNACNLFLCPAGNTAPTLASTTLSSSGTPLNLTALFTGTPPSGTTVTYHNATPVADNNYIGNSTNYTESGTVYAAFRAADGSCYSPATPAAITINCPDLEVTVSPVSGSSARETQTYTVTVKNNGSITATGAMVKVPIPSERGLVAAIPSLGTYNGSTYIWNIGQLTNGQSATLEITVRVQ